MQRHFACLYVLHVPPARVGGWSQFRTAMGEVCKEQQPWLFIIWRTCNALMCLFFTLASYVQINDPDAGLWMAGYGVPAALCAFIVWRADVTETLAWRRVADLHVMISCAVVSVLGWRLLTEKVSAIFQQEEGRECSGLMLTGVWLLLCRHSGRAPVGALRVSTAAAITVFPFAAWLYYHINKDLRSDWPSHCTTAL